MDRKDQLFVINEVSVNLFTSSTLGPACNEQFDAQKCAGSSPVLGITELVVRGSGGGGGGLVHLRPSRNLKCPFHQYICVTLQ